MGDNLMKKVNIKNIVIGEGHPKICVSLIGRDEKELEEGLDNILEAKKIDNGKNFDEVNIDIVEFRGDFFQGLNDKKRLTDVLKRLQEKLTDKIFLFTIRSEAEGGERLGFEAPAINDINEFVIKNHLADMVDVELFSDDDSVKKIIKLAKEEQVKIIMSNHDFKTTPPKDEIVGRLQTMESLGADIAKIAVMPENRRQLITLLDATWTIQEKKVGVPIVTMSMGKCGAISRITGEIFGSAITFASVGDASAPGQIPYGVMGSALGIVSKYCI
jgi:3-dehydroquinate dehydratase-1